MPDLTISVINYNTKNLTAKCLDSILEKEWKTNFQIFLIDNGSSDGSLDFFKKNYPKINLVDAKKNLGFAAGHNLILKKISTKYVLVLNSDTEILDKTIDMMTQFMDENGEVGISSCKILNYDGSLQPNGGDLPFGISIINWLFNLETFGIKSPSFHRNEIEYYKNTHQVGWVSGSFMMIRKKVFDKAGVFNEDFFMYMEDVEFCMRAKQKNFKIFINPSVSIKHASGGSLDNPKYRQWLGEYKGLITFYQNQFGIFAGVLVRSLIYIAVLLRVIIFGLKGKGDISLTYAKVITNL